MIKPESEYKPPFNGVEILQCAVDKVIRRRKAMGQYVIIGESGKAKKLDFSARDTETEVDVQKT